MNINKLIFYKHFTIFTNYVFIILCDCKYCKFIKKAINNHIIRNLEAFWVFFCFTLSKSRIYLTDCCLCIIGLQDLQYLQFSEHISVPNQKQSR